MCKRNKQQKQVCPLSTCLYRRTDTGLRLLMFLLLVIINSSILFLFLLPPPRALWIRTTTSFTVKDRFCASKISHLQPLLEAPPPPELGGSLLHVYHVSHAQQEDTPPLSMPGMAEHYPGYTPQAQSCLEAGTPRARGWV